MEHLGTWRLGNPFNRFAPRSDIFAEVPEKPIKSMVADGAPPHRVGTDYFDRLSGLFRKRVPIVSPHRRRTPARSHTKHRGPSCSAAMICEPRSDEDLDGL